MCTSAMHPLRVTSFLWLSFLAGVLTSHADDTTAVEVVPLAVGNQWTYRYIASDSDGEVVLSDTGKAVVDIVSRTDTPDSTVWVFRERREIVVEAFRFGVTYSHAQITDSTSYEVIESKAGQHPLHRNSREQDIWKSVFPWGSDITDSAAISRYQVVDRLGMSVLERQSTGSWVSHVYALTFRAGVGQTYVRCKPGPRVTGSWQNTYHSLLSATVTSIPGAPSSLAPNHFELLANYPNPFNPSTMVEFTLGERGWTRLEVFDVLGRSAALLADGELGPGSHRYQWNTKGLAGGVYFIRLKQGNFVQIQRALLVR
jgi:hypothetical protein